MGTHRSARKSPARNGRRYHKKVGTALTKILPWLSIVFGQPGSSHKVILVVAASMMGTARRKIECKAKRTRLKMGRENLRLVGEKADQKVQERQWEKGGGGLHVGARINY